MSPFSLIFSNCSLLVWTHDEGYKNDRYDFKVTCLTRCKDLEVTIKHKTGDVDLYGKAGEVPTIV